MPYQGADSDGLADMLVRFGVELRRCRHQRGLTQDRLARLSGVSQPTISRLEHGKAPYASLHLILRLSDAMEPAMPLAFCPHEHRCAWQRLDTSGAPVRRIAAGEAWWSRSRAPTTADMERPTDPRAPDATLTADAWPEAPDRDADAGIRPGEVAHQGPDPRAEDLIMSLLGWGTAGGADEPP
jgi:transcriptional regulator with XRE-family HTH domain